MSDLNWSSLGSIPASGQTNMPMTNQSSMPGNTQMNMPMTNQSSMPGNTQMNMPMTNQSSMPGNTRMNMPMTGQSGMPGNTQMDMSRAGQSSMPYMPQGYQQPAMSVMMDNTGGDSAVYPEVYYRLKPYISMMCDLITSSGDMLSQQQLETVTDSIYDDFCKSNPEMADYMSKGADKSDPPGDPPFRGGFMGGFRPGYGFRGFRRRGIGKDFITALLLSELLGRGGYYYY